MIDIIINFRCRSLFMICTKGKVQVTADFPFSVNTKDGCLNNGSTFFIDQSYKTRPVKLSNFKIKTPPKFRRCLIILIKN